MNKQFFIVGYLESRPASWEVISKQYPFLLARIRIAIANDDYYVSTPELGSKCLEIQWN